MYIPIYGYILKSNESDGNDWDGDIWEDDLDVLERQQERNKAVTVTSSKKEKFVTSSKKEKSCYL